MLDETDLGILGELERDSRQSTARIARRLRKPRVTVHEKIARMKSRGVIKRFTVEPDYALLGKPICAFILVGFTPSKGASQQALAKEISVLPGVQEVAIIAGEWDLIVKVRAESLESLGRLIVDRIRKLRGAGKTVTMAVLSSEKS